VIALQRIATLDVAAASGLCLIGGELVVIADDELALHFYAIDGAPRGRVALFPGSLPDEPRARKRAKPDLEALAALPDGRLLAIGSGSAPGRDRAALIGPLVASPAARAGGCAVREVDLSALYGALRRVIDPLNVEGACAVGDELVLLTRQTGRAGANALVRLDLAASVDAMSRGALDPAALRGVQRIELGAIDGAALGFTDAAAWRGGMLFSAAAEVTDDPVEDGACVGCEVGWMDTAGAVGWRERVDPCVKLEGIAVDGRGTLHAVADCDDRACPAPLFTARLPDLRS